MTKNSAEIDQQQWSRIPMMKEEVEDKKRMCRISHLLWAHCVSWTEISSALILKTICLQFNWNTWLIDWLPCVATKYCTKCIAPNVFHQRVVPNILHRYVALTFAPPGLCIFVHRKKSTRLRFLFFNQPISFVPRKEFDQPGLFGHRITCRRQAALKCSIKRWSNSAEKLLCFDAHLWE